MLLRPLPVAHGVAPAASHRSLVNSVAQSPCNWPRSARRAVQARATEEAVQVKPSTAPSPASNQQAAMAALASLQAGTAGEADSGLAAVTRDVLMADPETAEQLKRYEAALARVETAKAAAAELEDIFAQAAKEVALSEAQQQANTKLKASEVMANAEVQAAEMMLAAAEAEAARAQQAQQQWAEEAKQNLERFESTKAGAVAAVGGVLSSLPLLAASGATGLSAALTVGTTLGSCFLFGVTYRYAVRLDESNSHLRSGAVGAFGLVRAAAAGDVLQAGSALGPLDIDTVVGPAALYTGQSMMLFAFAAAAVELSFKQGLVRRFGAPPAEGA